MKFSNLRTVPWDFGARHTTTNTNNAPSEGSDADEKRLPSSTTEKGGNLVLPTDQAATSDPFGQYTTISERQLVRKLDLHLLPGVCLLYLLSFLDRSNVANARLEGLTESLHMTGNQYLTGLTLFFVGYIMFEVFWNIILKRIGPKIWLPSITFVWGIVATLQGIVVYNGGQSGVAGFFVVRYMLGVTEGGLFPGVVFYLSQWYLRHERQYRVALFFGMASLAGAFGGILAYGIAFMDGVAGLRGWRWIFILEGILTCVVAVFAFWFIADWPSKAHFVNEDERALINARLKADSDATQDEAFTWDNVLVALKDPKVWIYGLGFHTLSLPLYTLSLFLPSIIKALGYKAWQAQLLTIPPYALATVLTIAYAAISERLQRRAPVILWSTTTAMVGYCMLLGNSDPLRRPGVSYAGVFFCAAGIYPAVALTLSWPAMNVSGQTKRAVATGLQITIGNLGAVIGTQLYRSNDGPHYYVGHSVALAYLVGNCVVTLALWFILARINRKRDASMDNTEEWDGVWRGDDDIRWRFKY